MSTTSSASPKNLEVFVTSAGAATGRLDQDISAAAGPVNAFYDAPCDPRFRPAGDQAAFAQARTLASDNRIDERWIGGIRQAFLTADATTLPDATIASSLSAAGIVATAPGQITADEPVYQGAVMYSGWSDDPVSTGVGHFLEIEQDLAMPPALQVLGWARTYSSRFVEPESNGRGWHTWADARLDVSEAMVVYHGPDGQEVPFARAGSRLVGHPAMEGELSEADEGFELRWRRNARFPGMHWTFGGDGALRTVRDPFGGVTVAERDVDRRLTALAHQGGRRLEIRWDGERVAEIVSSDGRRASYRYDGDSLVEVHRPAGGRRYLLGDGRITEVFDADGVRLVRNEYDQDGRVLAQESPHGRVSRYRYMVPSTLVVNDDEGGPSTLFRHDAAGRLIEMQLADGRRSTRRFDQAGNPVQVVGFDAAVTRREFDLSGNCVREAISGGVERRFGYDEQHRLISLTDEVGAEIVLTYGADGSQPTQVSGPLGFECSFERHDGWVVAVTDSDGVRRTYQRDEEGQIVAASDAVGGTVSFCYHPSGAVAEKKWPTGDTERWEFDDDRAVVSVGADGARFERHFTAAGRLLAETGPGGITTRYQWGAHGSLEEVCDPLGGTRHLTWDQNGWLSQVTDPEDGVWSAHWDDLGRMAGATDASGVGWARRWDSHGNLAGIVDSLGYEQRFEVDGSARRVSVTTAAGRTLQLHWDPAYRLTGGSSPEGPSDCELRHDIAGRPVEWLIDGESLARATYTPAGRLATLSKPDGSMWQYRYDRAGRLVGTDGPQGSEEIVYDRGGRPVSLRRAEGHMTEFRWGPGRLLAEVVTPAGSSARHYDEWGRLVELVEEDGARWRWARDPLGRVTEVIDPLGAHTTLRRDGLGSVSEAIGPEGARWAYRRDAAGRLLGVTDPLGRQSGFDLDAGGRVRQLALPDGTQRAYRWDEDGATVAVEALVEDGIVATLLEVAHDWPSRAMTIRDGDGQALRLVWDGQNRITASESRAGLTSMQWDGGRRVVIDRPDGTVVTSRSHAAGLPEHVTHPALGDVVLERDGSGRLLEVTAAGLKRTWQRDPAGDTVRYREICQGAARETILERDPLGRVVAAVEDGLRRSYRYDAAGQLAGVDGPDGNWSWRYDRAGRLLAEDSSDGRRQFVYDGADQLQSVDGPDGTTVVSYDQLGRRVAEVGAEGTVRYHWDLSDRLIGIEHSGRGGTWTTDLAYDPLGRLVAVGAVPVVWETGGPFDGHPIRVGAAEIVELPGVPVAEIVGGEVTWLSADWRGNVGPRRAWGTATDASQGQGDARPAHPELGFLGELEVDGLVWLRHRWYDPATHAFLSRDPKAGSLVDAGGGLSPYQYANNDPLQWVDPSGLHPITADQASAQMEGWHEGHWKELVVTVGAVAAIAVLTIVAPEADALLIPMLIGGGAGAGGTVVGDLIHGVPIDWGQVVMDGALGALLGGGGAAVAGAGGIVANPLTGLAGRGALGLYGAGSGAGFTALDRWSTDAPFSLPAEGVSAGFGLLLGAAPHETAPTWQEESRLNPRQLRRFDRLGENAPRYIRRWANEGMASSSRLKAAAEATNLRRDAAFGGVGGAAAFEVIPPEEPAVPATLFPPHPAPHAPLPALAPG